MHQDMNSQPVAREAEGAMAKADLYRAAKHSMKLFQMIQDGPQLEGWVQAKITKAADYLDSIYHYMEYQVKFGGGGQVSSVQDITGDMETAAKVADDEAEEMEESMKYEDKLKALLESAVKKAKKDYDGDGEVESGKDEYMGSRDKAIKKAMNKKTTESLKGGQKKLDVDKDGDIEADDLADLRAGKKNKETKEGFEAGAKTGSTFKTSKGTATKTATGLVHKREKYDYDPGSDDKEMSKVKRDARNKKVKEGVVDTVKKVAKKVGKAITGPDDEELLQRLEKETGGKRPPKKDEKVKEASHQASTTMKHVKNPTAGEKKAAKDIKPGVKGYADRVAMLKSAEKDGRLKEADYSAKKAAAGKDIGKPGKNFEKIAKKSGGGEKGKRIAGAVLAKLRAKG
jgi:hypothetical protein